MDMRKKKRSDMIFMVVTSCAISIVLLAGVYYLKHAFTQDIRKERRIQMVKLENMPPPKILPKPPEQEIKKEEIEDSKEMEVQEQTQNAPDNQPPPGEQLGVDAEGGSGSDAFGLVGRKGGRALVGSGGSSGGPQTLMQKYGWYVRIIEEQISRELVKKGKIPSGGLQAFVRLVLDEKGFIMSHSIYTSSGSDQMDVAVEEALRVIRKVSEPPPEGMPRTMKIKITSSV